MESTEKPDLIEQLQTYFDEHGGYGISCEIALIISPYVGMKNVRQYCRNEFGHNVLHMADIYANAKIDATPEPR